MIEHSSVKTGGFLAWIFNYYRLVRKLVKDQRVSIWPKLFLVGMPLLYFLFPMPDDTLPVIGILDDTIFILLCAYIFVHLCPARIVSEHRTAISGCLVPDSTINIEKYRYPEEIHDLAMGYIVIFLLLALGGYLGAIIALGGFVLVYIANRMHEAQLLANAVLVTRTQLPRLYTALRSAQNELPDVDVRLFVKQDPTLNAYTFGNKPPYTIVLNSAMVEKFTPEEIQAIIGHELGHILFGHLQLTNLMYGPGQVAGLIFYRWRRACEYSADALALKASRNNIKVLTSAMVKMGSGLASTELNVDEFLRQVDSQEQSQVNIAERSSTHPFILNRVRRLIQLSRQPWI